MIPSAFLLTVIALMRPGPADAQTSISSSMQPSFGLGAMSPLGSGSRRQAGISLGSTEIATPGIAPVIPSQNMGTGICAGAGNARASSALFDGGGLPGSTSLSCADSRQPSASASSLSPIGRAGIPLGATELGNAGVSPPSVPGTNQSGGAIAASVGGTQPTSNAAIPGARP